MKLEVTQKGVHDAKGQRVAVGDVIEVDGDTVPAWLVNKVRPAGETSGKKLVVNPAEGDSPKTALEVLEMAKDPNVQFMSFKAAANKLLGEKTPAKKDEIIAALEELATQP